MYLQSRGFYTCWNGENTNCVAWSGMYISVMKTSLYQRRTGSHLRGQFLKFALMKAELINPKDNKELKFVTDLLKKLGIKATSITVEEMEDLGLSELLKKVDKSKKASKAEVLSKLGAY